MSPASFRTGILRLGRILAALLLATWAGQVFAQTTPSASTNTADADKAWKEVYKATQDPMPPAAWAEHEPSQKEQVDFYVPAL